MTEENKDKKTPQPLVTAVTLNSTKKYLEKFDKLNTGRTNPDYEDS
ncbi:MAG: hypothetical protein WBA52_12925 [Dolichospermum sp.]